MAENNSLNELNIPGLKIILSSKRSIWFRVVWTLAIMFSIALFLTQISERIDFFLNHSIGMKIVESDQIVPVLPKISICNSPSTLYGKNNYSIKNFDRNIPTWLCELKNQSIDESFKQLQIPIDNVNMIGQDNRNRWRKVAFAYQRWNSQIGSCITLSLKIETPVKKLHLSIKDSWYTPNPAENITYFEFYIHDETTPFTPEWIIKHSSLQSNEPLIAIIDSSKFSYLNSSKKPCVSKQNYEECRQKCLEGVQNLTRCELPYMTSTNDDVVPKCQNQDHCNNSVQQAHKIYVEFIPKECNCGTKCEWFLYNVQLGRALTNHYEGSILPTAHLELQFETFTRIEEYVAYNFVSLLSDIGGCLGLTLGLSILGLVETIASLIKWVRNIKIKRMKSKMVTKSIPTHSKLAVDAKNCYQKTDGKRWFHYARNVLVGSCRFKKRGRPAHGSKYSMEEDELPEISIPGMPVLYTECNIGRKIFWLIAITVCFVLSIMQINRHVQYLNNNSTAIRISVEENELITSPIITFCPVTSGTDLKYNMFFMYNKLFDKCAKLGYNNINHICDFLHIPNMTAEKIWQMYMPDPIQKVQNNIHYKDERLLMNVWGFIKLEGYCMAFQLKIKFPQNYFFYDATISVARLLWPVPGSPELFNMYLSDNLEFSDFEIFQHAQPIKANAENYVTVQITKFSYLNRSQSPCYDRSTVNTYHYECLENAVRKGASCDLPGLSLGLPRCNDTESCRRHHGHFVSTIRKFNWDKCEKQFRTCEGTVYKFSRYSAQHSVNTTTVIKFHFQDSVVKYVEEYVTYTFISLLCDAGAIFGVMMGACILTLLQLIELAIFGIQYFFKSKNSKPKANTTIVKNR